MVPKPLRVGTTPKHCASRSAKSARLGSPARASRRSVLVKSGNGGLPIFTIAASNAARLSLPTPRSTLSRRVVDT